MSLKPDLRNELEIARITQTLGNLEVCRMRAQVAEQTLSQQQIPELDAGAQLREIRTAWLESMENNLFWPERGVCLSDAHFHTYCTLVCRSHERYRLLMDPLKLPQLMALIAVHSSRHGVAFECPTAFTRDDFEQLLQCVAPFVVNHLAAGPTILRMQMQKTQDDEKRELQELRIKEAIELPLQELEQRKDLDLERHWLALQIEYQNDPDAKLKVLDSDVAGFLFRMDTEHCSEMLISVASRLFAQRTLELQLLDHYHMAACRIDDSELGKFQDWIATKGAAQLTDKFQVDIREFACEMMLPAGARMQALRNPDTRHQSDSAQSMLLSELGMNIVEQINLQFLNMRFDLLANNPQHAFYSLFVLSFVDYYFKQHMRIPWLETFFVCSSKFVFKSVRDSLVQEQNDSVCFVVPRRPRISFFCERWMVYHNRGWIHCASAAHAVVQWLRLVQDHHECTLDNDYDIKDFCSLFLREF